MKRIKRVKGLSLIKSDVYVTKEVMGEIIEDKVVETFYWLKQAYDAVPQDRHIREQITEISAQLLKTRRDISAAFEKPE